MNFFAGEKFRTISFVLFSLAGISCIAVIFAIGVYGFVKGPVPDNGEVSVVIPPESSFKTISRILIENKIIAPDARFRMLAGLMGVTGKLRAGEYVFTSAVSPYQVLKNLARGSMVQRAVTIPEGANLKQIAEIFAADGWINQTSFLALCNDSEFIAGFGLNVHSLEGYLFPDTYFFNRGGITAEKIISTMFQRMKEVLEESFAITGKPPKLTVHELLTLASIVEKETALADERPLIARVFLNRLKKGMKLQTDPTVIYGLEDFDGNLTRAHLKTHTPYNTYMIRGLPPGPIGSPGRAAIEAVLFPAEGSYYYFVSKNDGSHYFSKTLAEHNRAVGRYQKRR